MPGFGIMFWHQVLEYGFEGEIFAGRSTTPLNALCHSQVQRAWRFSNKINRLV
jgi:hypothetical protein